jgi:hypothetical protein
MYDHFMWRQVIAARENRRSPTAVSRLSGACWPGGGSDRLEPAAVAWVKRWRPASAAIALPMCACAVGRCAICN